MLLHNSIYHCKILWQLKEEAIAMSFDIKRITKFEHNIGAKEKKIRMIAGAVLLAITLFLGSVPLLILGIALIATAYSGWCPAYSTLGKNTCETGETKQE